MTFKDIASRGLNQVRRVKNRIEYQRRLSTVPDITLAHQQNVLIITIDCLRNDHLSRTNYDRNTTRYLDSLTEYTPAISAAPWTYSSVPSLLTGTYPHTNGVTYTDDNHRDDANDVLPHQLNDSVYTLAELLATEGYDTRFLTAIGTAQVPIQGRFKTAFRHHNAPAKDILDQLQGWWNTTSRPKFAYVQLGDLHEPLHIPSETPFGDIPDLNGINRWRYTKTTSPENDFAEYRKARIKLYDTLLWYIDRQIQSLLGSLHDRDDTIIIVTSDHGEEFWEYRDFEEAHFEDPRGIAGVGHGHALVPPVIEIPILSDSLPISSASGMASSIDIVPSILTALGVAVDGGFDGVSLASDEYIRPVLSQETAYGPNQISVTDNGDHLIHVPSREEYMLLDYETGELLDDENRVSELAQYLPKEKQPGAAAKISEGTWQHLADLGYAE